ncbi:hypothetical protein [Aquirufa sp.]|jgi:hypothetical protein|uniref:hypothetical protein n=1 Tax=Aquirufa sp. TaxID=2676249 RepID=UPI0037C04FE4
MKRFVIIIRGPVEGISGANSLATSEELEQIRTWLKAVKEQYQDMLYQKFSGQNLYLASTGKIEQKIVQLIDGGEISQVITLIMSSWEEATRVAESFPFPNNFYSLELREMA